MIFRYIHSGLFVTCVHVSILFSLIGIVGVSEVFSHKISFLCSFILSFIMQFLYVFDHDEYLFRSMVKFIIAGGLSYLLSGMIFTVEADFISDFKIVLATLTLIMCNYTLSRYFVFTHRKS